MACYILFLLYQRLREKHSWAESIFRYGGVIPLAVFALLGMLQISTDGALAFFMGVTLKRSGLLESHRRYNSIVAMGCFAFAVGLRILCQRLFDDTVFYKEVIAPGTHVMIAGAFLVGVKWLFGVFPKMMNQIASSKIMKHIDKISIYVYVSHGWLIAPFFSLSYSRIYSLLLFLSAIFIIGTILSLIGEWFTHWTEKTIEYLFL